MMMKMITLMCMSMILSVTMMMVCLMMSKKSKMDMEKMSPFECGFDPKTSARMPFSIQFFLIGVLFLIFDIEIIIILPMIITMKSTMLKDWMMTISIFIIIMLLGLMYEWKMGVLEWMN
uniref:NADH-ubiquinone oxidoreductase chain 3 n=1 Tax=Kokeshia sp. NKU02 TaxID=1124182 RepID=A0A0X7YJW4_9HEMI|nr:NADH dehydrogenase subunit 3 [Kokeshia sp. NKU02]